MNLERFHQVSQVSQSFPECETCETSVNACEITLMRYISIFYNTVKLVKAVFELLSIVY